MSTINITLLGFENYLNRENKSVFDGLTVPASIDRDTLTNNILLRGGEFESLYGDPYFLRDMVGVWSNKMTPVFTKWAYAMSMEYNPIENYDRYEDILTKNTGTIKNGGKTTTQGDNTTTIENNTENSTTDNGTISDVGANVNKVSAFNSDTMRDNTTDETNNTRVSENDSTTSMSQTGTNETKSNTSTAVDNTTTNNLNEQRTAHIHGNIGVTTSSAMVSEFNELQAEWNLYDKITDLFLSEFTLMVY